VVLFQIYFNTQIISLQLFTSEHIQAKLIFLCMYVMYALSLDLFLFLNNPICPQLNITIQVAVF